MGPPSDDQPVYLLSLLLAVTVFQTFLVFDDLDSLKSAGQAFCGMVLSSDWVMGFWENDPSSKWPSHHIISRVCKINITSPEAEFLLFNFLNGISFNQQKRKFLES